MAFERISDNLNRLNENIRSFAASSAEYYKLDLYNKTMKGATAAVKGVAIAFFLVFALLFLSIALSVLISNWLESPSGGFFIMGGLYLLVGLYIIFFGGPIIDKIMLSKTSKRFFQDNNTEEASGMDKQPARDPELERTEIIIEDERIQ